jgi:hypothetical protein
MRGIHEPSFGERHVPYSASDMFLTVAVMSTTFLIEIGFFILVGMF